MLVLMLMSVFMLTLMSVFMLMFVCKPDKVYRQQIIKNPNRNRPGGWIGVNSTVLQSPFPLSTDIWKFRIDIITQVDWLCPIFISKMNHKRYNYQLLQMVVGAS